MTRTRPGASACCCCCAHATLRVIKPRDQTTSTLSATASTHPSTQVHLKHRHSQRMLDFWRSLQRLQKLMLTWTTQVLTSPQHTYFIAAAYSTSPPNDTRLRADCTAPHSANYLDPANKHSIPTPSSTTHPYQRTPPRAPHRDALEQQRRPPKSACVLEWAVGRPRVGPINTAQ